MGSKLIYLLALGLRRDPTKKEFSIFTNPLVPVAPWKRIEHPTYLGEECVRHYLFYIAFLALTLSFYKTIRNIETSKHLSNHFLRRVNEDKIIFNKLSKIAQLLILLNK